ncbi:MULTISPECIES: hypothetical protein [Pseudomonas]|nr:hypothetical protein [Pseudomonas aeruginosa]AUA70368.1 hypothetical protein CWI25_10185 [Pseudomonas aeruginosa]AUA94930.1 hypothetical protein CWI24_10370 [Pseudomonas aeruginosa]EJV1364924.1 hypothetical protein [Pseudomonas aeruginosa]EJV1383889.1 hypothetical protein [Pseudomonas aeruginosa]EJV1607379.1 hypothetical protein [Pseudomonas aeruginosa]
MHEISLLRFNALAAYCRTPEIVLISEELRWYEAADGQILATLIRDYTDSDYSGMILARDERECFRWVSDGGWHDTEAEAIEALERKIEEIIPNLERIRKQGSKGKPVDFFTPRPKLKQPLDNAFQAVTSLEGYTPAKNIIEPMMRWHEDADGNFIEQFQTTGFDARIWELYLFAVLTEARFAFDRSVAIPDFVCKGILGELCVEATTVNPTRDKSNNIVPPPQCKTEEEFFALQDNYFPIKYAGPLTAKLDKRYWEKESAQGKPFVIAIQDFHSPMAMNLSRGALPTYLYGYKHNVKRSESGELIIEPVKVDNHIWGSKNIESGFFNFEGAENISAVIFNSSATISKFNRLGLLAGFGSPRVKLLREGLVVDQDPNASSPKEFSMLVNSHDYHESWIEGMDVYHNPRALHPLPPEMLMGAAHHRLLPDGQVESIGPGWQPLASVTKIFIDEETAA